MTERPLGRIVAYGIFGSLLGAAVMGVLMTNAGFMDRVASLVGTQSTTVGWIVHLTFAIILGVMFGLFVARTTIHPVLVGLTWGALIWLLGFMVLFPLALDATGQVLALDNSFAWYGLAGHLLYGLIAGGMAYALVRRDEETRQTMAA